MDIDFDPVKDAANRAKHGLALADALMMDLETALVLEDSRSDYGERRFRAFQRIEGKGYCLAFVIKGDVIRLISFRRAHDKEMRRYEE